MGTFVKKKDDEEISIAQLCNVLCINSFFLLNRRRTTWPRKTACNPESQLNNVIHFKLDAIKHPCYINCVSISLHTESTGLRLKIKSHTQLDAFNV